jgi:hypothetical protein
MFRTPFSTTVRDLALSLMVTPRKSPLLEAIDNAAKECRNERRNASSMERFNDVCEALDKIHEARALIVGGQP